MRKGFGPAVSSPSTAGFFSCTYLIASGVPSLAFIALSVTNCKISALALKFFRRAYTPLCHGQIRTRDGPKTERLAHLLTASRLPPPGIRREGQFAGRELAGAQVAG